MIFTNRQIFWKEILSKTQFHQKALALLRLILLMSNIGMWLQYTSNKLNLQEKNHFKNLYFTENSPIRIRVSTWFHLSECLLYAWTLEIHNWRYAPRMIYHFLVVNHFLKGKIEKHNKKFN